MKEIYVHCYLVTTKTTEGWKRLWKLSSMTRNSKEKADFFWESRRKFYDKDKEMIIRIKENGEMSVYKHTLKREPDLKKIFG